MISAEYYMHTVGAYDNVIFAGVDNHTLTFGMEKQQTIGADWCIFDDFTLTYYGNQPESYRQWLTEMKKKKLSYASVTVSNCYSDAYNTAYKASANDRASAIAAMKAIDAAAEEIAYNAELWAEYKQVGEEALAILNGNEYSDEAKDFLRIYYELVYQKRLSELELTNEQLPRAIEELRTYIGYIQSGEWTGISGIPDNCISSMKSAKIFTIDGKQVCQPNQHGLYIMQGHDGKIRKVLR